MYNVIFIISSSYILLSCPWKNNSPNGLSYKLLKAIAGYIVDHWS